MFEKIVVVTRKTRLEGLIERFNSRAQAKFYLDHSDGDFADYEREDATYRQAVETVRRTLDVGLKIHVAERSVVRLDQERAARERHVASSNDKMMVGRGDVNFAGADQLALRDNYLPRLLVPRR